MQGSASLGNDGMERNEMRPPDHSYDELIVNDSTETGQTIHISVREVQDRQQRRAR